MVYSSLFLPNFVPLSQGKSTTSSYTRLFHPTNYFPSTIQCNYTPKRAFPSPQVASIATPTPYNPPSVSLDYFKSEFNGHGITFEGISDSYVVKMALDDGSAVSLMLPSGLITSYKAPMWHGGTFELLHTFVSESENSAKENDVLIQGGVSLAFNCKSDAEREVSWSPNTWTLHNVKGDPQELIQVELVGSGNAMDMVQLKHIVTLQQGLLSSEIVISNQKSSPIGVMGYMMSHLNVSTPEATYVLGLEGSDFYSRTPISSNFSIIPPLEPFSVKKDSTINKFWGPLSEIFSMSSGRTHRKGVSEEAEGEESDNYKHLTDRMCRIYTSAPRCFTLIDRGKRNSVEVERNGFNELYMFSPGSTHKWYGKYAYICFGQSALLEPIFLAPGGEWRGLQALHNPNF